MVEACARHGVYTILDLHALPGAQNQHWHSDNPTHWAQFWTHRHFQDRVVHLWEAIADRYKDQEWIAGYNPVNEPADASGEVIGPFYRRLEAAIRAVDPRHVLFLDGNRYSTDFDVLGDPLPNTVYTAHDYALPGFPDSGPYPGTSRGRYVDRDVVEKTFLPAPSTCAARAPRSGSASSGRCTPAIPDATSIATSSWTTSSRSTAEHDASWALWTYKDIGLQGVVCAAPDSPYVRRIQPVLEKKARLGVDSWGSTDAGVRHILDPIEATFAEEFPGYDPFPWGSQRWVHLIVRHILLAEPMVADFGRCFEGLSPDEAEALADSFRLDRCVQRRRLVEILRARRETSTPASTSG